MLPVFLNFGKGTKKKGLGGSRTLAGGIRIRSHNR